MKHYRNTRAFRLRLFLRAIEGNPGAHPSELAQLAHIARNTAEAYRDHIVRQGLSPAHLLDLADQDLCAAMSHGQRASKLHPFDGQEIKLLRKKGFNKKQCYRRYLETVPDGVAPMSLRTFRDRLQSSEHKDPAMKLVFVAGDAMMADYAGEKPEAISPFGMAHEYSLFVATLPCSQRVFAAVHEYQRVEDWIDGMTDAIHTFGGIPRRLIPDNPKAQVVTPRRGNTPAVLHPAFEQLCDHYRCKGDPARPGKPNDKSLVETAVNLIQQELVPELALRPRIHLDDLKALLARIVDEINNRPMEKRGGRSRMDWFDETDRQALKPITMGRHQHVAHDTTQQVTRQYRVTIEGSTYSVPHTMIGKSAYCRATRTGVEIYVDGKIVAQHPRARHAGLDLLIDAHMPERQAAYHYMQDGHMLAWGEGLGEDVRAVVAFNLDAPAPGAAKAQRMRGLQRLQHEFGTERLIQACKLAVAQGRLEYRTLRNMLENGRDKPPSECRPVENGGDDSSPPALANVRGAAYYAGRLG